MAPFGLVESSTSQSIPWWTVMVNVLAAISVGFIAIFTCACCGGKRKRLEKIQRNLDVAVIPPPEILCDSVPEATQYPVSKLPEARDESETKSIVQAILAEKPQVFENPRAEKYEDTKIPREKRVTDESVKTGSVDSAVFAKPGQELAGVIELQPTSMVQNQAPAGHIESQSASIVQHQAPAMAEDVVELKDAHAREIYPDTISKLDSSASRKRTADALEVSCCSRMNLDVSMITRFSVENCTLDGATLEQTQRIRRLAENVCAEGIACVAITGRIDLSTKSIIWMINRQLTKRPKGPVMMLISSGGGESTSGNELGTFVKDKRKLGVRFIALVIVECCSAAVAMFSQCSDKFMDRGTNLLFHWSEATVNQKIIDPARTVLKSADSIMIELLSSGFG